jgi:hypothetical protein
MGAAAPPDPRIGIINLAKLMIEIDLNLLPADFSYEDIVVKGHEDNSQAKKLHHERMLQILEELNTKIKQYELFKPDFQSSPGPNSTTNRILKLFFGGGEGIRRFDKSVLHNNVVFAEYISELEEMVVSEGGSKRSKKSKRSKRSKKSKRSKRSKKSERTKINRKSKRHRKLKGAGDGSAVKSTQEGRTESWTMKNVPTNNSAFSKFEPNAIGKNSK